MTTTLPLGKGLDLPLEAVTVHPSKRFDAPLSSEELASLRSRLFAKTAKSSGCWLWTGYVSSQGYGVMSRHDHPVYVHRVSFVIHRGPIPRGLCVLHRCDVPLCVRPAHLLLGTQLENIADMRAKGRGSKPPTFRGEAHHQAHLSDAQVAEIRSRRAQGETQRALAKAFGVSQSTVWRLVHRMYRSDGV